MSTKGPEARGAGPGLVAREDAAGLLAFLGEVARDGEAVCGLGAQYVQLIRSTWESVCRTVDLPTTTLLADIDLDDLLDRFAAARGGSFRSASTYRTRLRRGVDLFAVRRSDDPAWRQRGVCRLSQARVRRVRFERLVVPLRPGVAVTVEVPQDLRPREAELLSLLLANMAVESAVESPGEAVEGPDEGGRALAVLRQSAAV